MKYPYEETGERILNMRKKQGLTREKLAEMSDISVQFLADIEKGRKNMTVTTLRKIASALLVTTDYIVNGNDVSVSGNDNELIELCNALSPEMQVKASKLLRVFIESIDTSNP